MSRAMPEEPQPPQIPPPRNEAERLKGVELPPPEDEGGYPPHWEPHPRRNLLGALSRVLLLLVVLGMLVMPFTPLASRIKNGLGDLIEKARSGKVIVKE